MKEVLPSFAFHIPRTIFGMNTSEQVGVVAKELGATKALIITDQGVHRAGLIKSASDSLQKAGIDFEVFYQMGESAPGSAVLECAKLILEKHYDVVVGIGGGSVLDGAKLAAFAADHGGTIEALFNPPPISKKIISTILVPTTAGTGSEMGIGALWTDEKTHGKMVVFSDLLCADAAVIDPILTMNLPPVITADTGIDVLSHAIEGYTSPKANPVADIVAEKAIRLVAQNLRSAYTQGAKDPEARYNMMLAANLGMTAGYVSGCYIVHTLSYPVGAMTHQNHGKICGLLLPYVMDFNLISNLERFARIAEFMDEPISGMNTRGKAIRSIQAVKSLVTDLGLPQTLGEIGLTKKDIPAIIDYVYKYYPEQLDWNPRRVDRNDLQRILESAL